MKVRKKPVEVEAYKLTYDNCGIVADWCNGHMNRHEDNFEPYIQIITLEGVMVARVGDYVIKGVEGEFYPCAPGIFDKTYEVISE